MISQYPSTLQRASRLDLCQEWETPRLRNALGQFATGVTIITTQTEAGERVGLTANSFNSVSLEPALVLWSLGKNQGSCDAFRSCTHFAINILADSQLDLSRRFSSFVQDRFDGVDYSCDEFGVPLIDGCAGWLVCKHQQHYELGDHFLFIGKVEALGGAGGLPLVYHAGKYAQLESRA